MSTKSSKSNDGRDDGKRVDTGQPFLIKHYNKTMAGLAGLIATSTGSALSFVQSNVRGPSLHLLLGLLHLASLATDSRREHLTGPMIISPSATRLKERSSPVVLVYYPRDVLNRFFCIIAHGS